MWIDRQRYRRWRIRWLHTVVASHPHLEQASPTDNRVLTDVGINEQLRVIILRVPHPNRLRHSAGQQFAPHAAGRETSTPATTFRNSIVICASPDPSASRTSAPMCWRPRAWLIARADRVTSMGRTPPRVLTRTCGSRPVRKNSDELTRRQPLSQTRFAHSHPAMSTARSPRQPGPKVPRLDCLRVRTGRKTAPSRQPTASPSAPSTLVRLAGDEGLCSQVRPAGTVVTGPRHPSSRGRSNRHRRNT